MIPTWLQRIANTVRRVVLRVGSMLIRLGGGEFTDVTCPECDGCGEVVHDDIDCDVCADHGGFGHAVKCPICQGAAVLDAIYFSMKASA